jgi:hypothetical protein
MGLNCGGSGRPLVESIETIDVDEQFTEQVMTRARAFESFPRIVEVSYKAGPGLDYLELRLDTGTRMLIPREMLGELKSATTEQAKDVVIGPQGRSVWWPQLDDGLYLPDFLEHRWGKERQGLAA